MIKLYQFPSAMSIPNASPFCMKVETYLRMVDLDYELVLLSDPRKAPKGKLPFIEDDGQKIADSGLILKYLAKKYPSDLNKHLSPQEHGVGLAITRLLEEHLYWVLVYSRWMDERYSAAVMKIFFGKIPWPLRSIVISKASKDVKGALHAQGIGRHSCEEIYQMGAQDVGALAEVLGQNDYLLGNQVSSYDASAFSCLASLLMVRRIETPLQKAAASHENLVAYTKRMAHRYFPEYPKEKKI